MGGNCLKHYGVNTVRLNREEYLELEKELFDKIREAGVEIHKLPFYRKKETFGDLDAVVKFDPSINLREIIQNQFAPRKISVNDGVFTFDYQNFQCDLICRKESDLPCVIHYLSWNDLNNLVGRTAHHMGLNHGWQGLRFPIRQKLFEENVNDSSDHVIETLVLSRDPKEIMEFLGYDYEIYLRGFDTLEEIFLYAVSTPYFCGKNFRLENLNHQNRTRNRKRTVFMEFLKWLEANPEYDKEFNFGRKRDWIDTIDKKWPIKNRIEEVREEFLNNKELSAKFNGRHVMELTPLRGKELGSILGNYRNSKTNWKEFVENNSSENIKIDFMSYYDNYKA